MSMTEPTNPLSMAIRTLAAVLTAASIIVGSIGVFMAVEGLWHGALREFGIALICEAGLWQLRGLRA